MWLPWQMLRLHTTGDQVTTGSGDCFSAFFTTVHVSVYYKFKEKLEILSSTKDHRKKSKETREVASIPADTLVNI